jgi:transcription initiation factor IIE alpha subunit
MAVKLPVKPVSCVRTLGEAAVCLSLAEGKVTTRAIADATGYHMRSVRRALAAMRDRGIVDHKISYEGTGKYTMWYPKNLADFRRRVCSLARNMLNGRNRRAGNGAGKTGK